MTEQTARANRSAFGRFLAGLDRLLGWVENAMLSGGILLMAGLNIANVLGDNLLHQGIASTEEINQALLVIITFVGVAKGARHGRNIRMSAVYDQLKGVPRKALNVVITTGTAVLMFALAWFAIDYEAQVRALGQATPSLGIPLWLIYLWVPIGLTLSGIQYLLTTFRNLTAPELYRSFTERETYDTLESEIESALIADDEPDDKDGGWNGQTGGTR